MTVIHSPAASDLKSGRRLQGSLNVERAITEQEWMGTVLDAARLFGWSVYHTYDSRKSQPGFPDLILVRGPRMLVIELKTERGKVRPEQVDWLARLAEVREVTVMVARPSQWDAVLAQLRRDE